MINQYIYLPSKEPCMTDSIKPTKSVTPVKHLPIYFTVSGFSSAKHNAANIQYTRMTINEFVNRLNVDGTIDYWVNECDWTGDFAHNLERAVLKEAIQRKIALTDFLSYDWDNNEIVHTFESNEPI